MRRSQGAPYDIISIALNVANVSVKDLRVDGNRYGLGLAGLSGIARNPYIDVNAGVSKNFTFQGDIVNSVGFGLNGPGAITPNDTTSGGLTVSYSYFSLNGLAAVRAYNNFNMFSSSAWQCGVGCIEVRGTNSNVSYTTIGYSHAEFPYGFPGGQLVVDGCARYVNIFNNFMIGGYVQSGSLLSNGMEVYGSDVTISDNVIKEHAGGGVNVDRITDNPNGCNNVSNSGRLIAFQNNSIQYNLQTGLGVFNFDYYGVPENISISGGSFIGNGFRASGSPGPGSLGYGIGVFAVVPSGTPFPITMVSASFSGNKDGKCINVYIGSCL